MRIMNRVVLVGDLLPSSDKWQRVISSAGGHVAITKGTMTAAVRQLEEIPSSSPTKLAVIPDQFKENKLVKTLRSLGYSFVPSRYV